MSKLHANTRVNLNSAGQLCTDTDPNSAALFATPGQEFDAEELAKYPNASDFFDDGSEDARVARHAKKTAAAGSVRVVSEGEDVPAPKAEVLPKKTK